jgi:hypothetical protein
MTNRIKLGGVWHHIDDLQDYALSRCHSDEYKDGCVYQVAFGSNILELSVDQSALLRDILWLGVAEPDGGEHVRHG